MWLGLLIPFFGTTLGSAIVYFIKNKKNELLSRCFSGIASGVMVAASIWSLLIPAMEQEKNILVIVLGIFLGALLLLFLDCIVPHMHPGTNDEEGKESHLKKTTKLVFAVTLHNIPEGMAVGIVLASDSNRKYICGFSFIHWDCDTKFSGRSHSFFTLKEQWLFKT